MRIIQGLGLALGIGAAIVGAVVAADSFETEADTGFVEVTTTTDLATVGVKNQGAPAVAAAIKNALTNQPAGTKVRILVGSLADGSGQWTCVYLRSIVLLDAEGKPNGEEKYVADAKASYRLVPWVHGVKEGVEKEFINSVLRGEAIWKAGQMDGMRKTYFEDGKVESETPYINGKANGISRTYDKKGLLVREGTMKNGKRDAAMTDYWEDSKQPKRVANYRDGQANGPVKEYYLSGKLKREATLKDDSLQGEEKQYNEDGKVSLTRYWFKGDVVTPEEFKKMDGK